MVWAVQDVLYRYMQATTKLALKSIPLDDLEKPPPEMSILFFIYGMEMNKEQNRFELKLHEIYGGTKESFARVLEPMEVPEPEALLKLLQAKIQNKESAFSIHTPLSESLAKVAREIVHESPTDYGSNE